MDIWLLMAVSEGRRDLQQIHSISTRLGAAGSDVGRTCPRPQTQETGAQRGGSQAPCWSWSKPPCLSSPTQGAPAAWAGATAPLSQAVTEAAADAAAIVMSRLGSQAAGLPFLSPSSVCSRASPDPCLNASSTLHHAPVQRQADVTLSP